MCRRHLISGFLRTVPKPVQGASSRTRSKRPTVWGLSARASSASVRIIVIPCLCPFFSASSSFQADLSTLNTSPSFFIRMAMWADFTPKPQHRSRTRSPRPGASSIDTICEASSWVCTRPSRKGSRPRYVPPYLFYADGVFEARGWRRLYPFVRKGSDRFFAGSPEGIYPEDRRGDLVARIEKKPRFFYADLIYHPARQPELVGSHNGHVGGRVFLRIRPVPIAAACAVWCGGSRPRLALRLRAKARL